MLVESGGQLEDRGSLEDIPLPDTVWDAVKARVEHLSSKACQVLEAGAVLGQTFTFDTVQGQRLVPYIGYVEH
ncbi:MAG: hypothetical protein GY832_42860 [Chloroflexi bacterium]|nr:hypothetical protein [Chloroflexota bacterium]